ncbi:DUF4261 domain-containing protein [Paludisphaera mucosa]|uniref:DUF4261 domain-containing protein n=1 Tax=Paludisphaera mucosa TaxID=3030827 RepID=A0ABT6FAM9_9BACT|nr:DUF4261 domain-containing protein [Paludisphaera mucosa]MDG3004632.1 DUF4261 domain-containing protein [Paludisphaera mucosa]
MAEAEPAGFAQTYGVEILYETPLAIDGEELLRAVRVRRPAAQPLGDLGAGGGEVKTLGFVHPDHAVELSGAVIRPQTFLLATDAPLRLTAMMEDHLGQSWSFPDARQAFARRRSSALLTDMMTGSLDYQARIEIFEDVLAAVLQVAPALAIHWWPAGRFVDPAIWLEAYREGGADRLFAGAMNVRFYKISDSPGDMLMDTLGLAALGVRDLQCHFRDLDPSEVATLLANTGCYLFDEGDLIADGHTIEGLTPGSRWMCRHEDSILNPARIVLNVDPGPPHTAAGRADRDQGGGG